MFNRFKNMVGNGAMVKYLVSFGISLVLLAGCSSSDDTDNGGGLVACGSGNSPYYGCWVTSGCQSIENPFGNEPVWGVVRYNFASNGNIYDQVKVYTNSSCNGSPVYNDESFTDFTFSELGTEMLQSGLTGYRLRVEDVTTNGQGVSEVLVAVTANSQLCLSDNLQLSSANGYVFVLQQNATDVDLVSNCLDAY